MINLWPFRRSKLCDAKETETFDNVYRTNEESEIILKNVMQSNREQVARTRKTLEELLNRMGGRGNARDPS